MTINTHMVHGMAVNNLSADCGCLWSPIECVLPVRQPTLPRTWQTNPLKVKFVLLVCAFVQMQIFIVYFGYQCLTSGHFRIEISTKCSRTTEIWNPKGKKCEHKRLTTNFWFLRWRKFQRFVVFHSLRERMSSHYMNFIIKLTTIAMSAVVFCVYESWIERRMRCVYFVYLVHTISFLDK